MTSAPPSLRLMSLARVSSARCSTSTWRRCSSPAWGPGAGRGWQCVRRGPLHATPAEDGVTRLNARCRTAACALGAQAGGRAARTGRHAPPGAATCAGRLAAAAAAWPHLMRRRQLRLQLHLPPPQLLDLAAPQGQGPRPCTRRTAISARACAGQQCCKATRLPSGTYGKPSTRAAASAGFARRTPAPVPAQPRLDPAPPASCGAPSAPASGQRPGTAASAPPGAPPPPPPARVRRLASSHVGPQRRPLERSRLRCTLRAQGHREPMRTRRHHARGRPTPRWCGYLRRPTHKPAQAARAVYTQLRAPEDATCPL